MYLTTVFIGGGRSATGMIFRSAVRFVVVVFVFNSHFSGNFDIHLDPWMRLSDGHTDDCYAM